MFQGVCIVRTQQADKDLRFTLVGNWTVTLSINFGGAQLILSAITLWNEDFVATRKLKNHSRMQS
jgi:hypothetical protein